MRRLSFVINVIPTPQARPRFSRHGQYVKTYKSSTQEANERTLEALLAPYAPEKPLSGPVTLVFTATFPVPKSASKKRREAMLRGKIKHTKKPDLDNLTKQLKDCLTRLQFWLDDKQVYKNIVRKNYGEHGQWSIRLIESDE